MSIRTRIEITGSPVMAGNNRDIYVHPDDPELLLKVIKESTKEMHFGPNADWKKKSRFRRYYHYMTFVRECCEYIVGYLDKERKPEFTQEVVGFVDTNLGLALITKAERDRDGSYAKTLSKLIAEDLFDAEARNALNEFKRSFMESRVMVTDLSIRNLVYSYDEGFGHRFFVIDGYGQKNIIPFTTFCERSRLRNKRKRLERLERAIIRETARRNQSNQGQYEPNS